MESQYTKRIFIYIFTNDCKIKIVGWIEVNKNYPKHNIQGINITVIIATQVQKSLQKLDFSDSLA
jgi:hypothetical protein